MIGVLVSGEGTNLQAILDAGLAVRAVASSRRDARALERAEAALIPAAAFELSDFESREERDVAMADWLEEHGVTLVACAGYMHLLTPAFLARFERIVNIHPSLLPAPSRARRRSRTRWLRERPRPALPSTGWTKASTRAR